MIWKTDWSPADNYARAGADDIDRLLANYNALKTTLNADFGFAIVFSTPTTEGYRTFAFADILNSVETCLNALHVWTVDWWNKVVTWRESGTLPTYEDINRWEQNGAAIELAAQNARAAFRHSGTFYSGQGGLIV